MRTCGSHWMCGKCYVMQKSLMSSCGVENHNVCLCNFSFFPLVITPFILCNVRFYCFIFITHLLLISKILRSFVMSSRLSFEELSNVIVFFLNICSDVKQGGPWE